MKSLKRRIEDSMKNIFPTSAKLSATSSANAHFMAYQQRQKTPVVIVNCTSYINANRNSHIKEGAVKDKSKDKKKIRSTVNTPKEKKNKQNVGVISLKNRSPWETPCRNSVEKTEKRTQRNDYKFVHQVGSGGFGRVWKVENKKTGNVLAMKQISKAKVIMKKSVNSVINEKDILQSLSNPFLINMKAAFQDREYLYLVMEYLRGGDLRYHMCFYEHFDEEQTKFIVSCIVLSLEYIHSRNIIHRDLKPENLVFENTGYLRITDFGVARAYHPKNSEQTSGTPGYMSPEVICRMNHSFETDFFALGVIIFEIITGSRPYLGDSRQQIRQKILARQAKITLKDLPNSWSVQCLDFVNRLLRRNKQSRLGYNGIHEVKSHQWLKSINWSKLQRKQIVPPFIPGIITESLEYQKQIETSSETEVNQQTKTLLRTSEIQNLFKSYQQKTKVKRC